ncbi:MAG: pyrroline-5-carboxylate reductase [Candidatus Saganbacteria bacterium]|uniref:Pyrroline-5-carboxylate reductase n=1 Tax=Candidatus Saganbacteria bacterium TaxID=2575572 RepID=A0A833L0P5_UNCSA|nr:MAG: pyrroline-5-carboxylate reductase [Candidatus Saganbacteria bacterium]
MKKKENLSFRADKIAIIGGGRMCEALLRGLVKKQIIVSDIQKIRRDYIKKNFQAGVTNSNQQAVDFGDVIIFAVKPQAMKEAVKDLKIKQEKLIISIAAGIPISYLKNNFKNNPIIRAMPNNPALIGEGITAISYGEKVKEADKKKALGILKLIGDVVEIDERYLDAVTGLSGSGPAFLYLFAEGMIEAGEAVGIKREAAYKLAVQTVYGAAKTLLSAGKNPKELIEMVSSPGGTTLRGLDVLYKKEFKTIISEAVKSAANRAKELSQELT